ncbi:putative integral membrane protein [Cryptosporidium felis]|nr:putative integral membrane protein [Cryptosporidium felis]
MRIFIGFLLLIYCIGPAVTLNGIKRRRASLGMVFKKTTISEARCSLLQCKEGGSYAGTGPGECFTVVRCQNCKTSFFSASLCSTITAVQSEVTLFQGNFQISHDRMGLFDNKGGSVDSGSELADTEDFSESTDLEPSEEDEGNGEKSGISENSNIKESEGDSSSSSTSYGDKMSYSLLELFSQVDESEIEENEGTETKGTVKPRRKGFMKRFINIGKNKADDDHNKVATIKKTNKLSFKIAKMFNKFHSKKDKNEPKSDSKVNELTDLSLKMSGNEMRKGMAIELKLNGKEIKDRTNACTEVNGEVFITVHTFLQFFNIKKQSHLKMKNYKYAAFELMVDTACKFDDSCKRPSIFMGRLTPRQKLILSNSLTIPALELKKNGLSNLIGSIRANYKCKSPRCFPEQYNSCVKITCSMNKAALDEWNRFQMRNIQERERELQQTISDELRNFRNAVEDERTLSINAKETKSQDEMNGPFSFNEVVNDTTSENAPYKFEESNENEGSKQNIQGFEVHDDNSILEDHIIEPHQEGEIVVAPSDKEKSLSLEERLRRSLGTSADEEEKVQSKVTKDESIQDEEESSDNIPIQPEIQIGNVNTRNQNNNLKMIIYITLGVTCVIIIITGIICIS